MDLLRPAPRTAFSLIELLIAMGLGSAVLLVAVAGMRGAANATTTVSRMCIENALMRMAAEDVMDEVDFWTSVDSVHDRNQQPLRGLVPARQGGHQVGQAFTPFNRGWPEPGRIPAYPADPVERSCAYHPGPLTWAAHDPRTWCRANGAERDRPGTYQSDVRHGDYGLFATADPQSPLHSPFDPQRCRSWYDRQVRSIIDALGFYGMCEYLPSSAFFVLHGDPPASAPPGLGPGRMPSSLLRRGGWMCVDDADQNFMRGRERSTGFVSFPLPNPGQPMVAAGKGRSDGDDPNRIYWYVGSTDLVQFGSDTANADGRADLIERFLSHTGHVVTDMPVRPSSWPEVRAHVHRFLRYGRFVNLCIIDSFNAASGEQAQIPFTCFGTTLRGARQQRAPTAGWSVYDNRNPKGPVIGACLDHPRYTYEDRMP